MERSGRLKSHGKRPDIKGLLFPPATRHLLRKHALWHAELRFPEPVTGPLMVGDGRFLGLGLFEVLPQQIDVLAFLVALTWHTFA